MAAQDPLLVLGATSLVGRFLPPRAEAAGIELVRVSRRPVAGAGWIAADLAAPEGRAALPPAREVLSLAPAWVLTPALLEALADRGMQRLVAFSSTSRFTKADSPDPAERAVAARLAEGEAAVERVCGARGVAWTILRPTLIWAEGLDGNVSRLAALARRFGALPLAGRGGGRRQPVHADDLAAGALAALASPATEGRTYDLAGGETLSYRAMCERVFEGLGRRPRLVPVPPLLWRAGLALASPWLPGATAQMGQRMDRDLVFDDGPARRDFGWKPRGFRPVFPRPQGEKVMPGGRPRPRPAGPAAGRGRRP